MASTCIIALSFGMGEGQDNYGLSNLKLAEVVSDMLFPVLAQWEVANLMESEFSDQAFESIEKDGGKYLDSFDVLTKAYQIMNELGFEEAILIGHQDHLPRIKLLAKKMGIKISRKPIPDYYIPYDPKSTQFWTRNRFYFVTREILYCTYLFIINKI